MGPVLAPPSIGELFLDTCRPLETRVSCTDNQPQRRNRRKIATSCPGGRLPTAPIGVPSRPRFGTRSLPAAKSAAPGPFSADVWRAIRHVHCVTCACFCSKNLQNCKKAGDKRRAPAGPLPLSRQLAPFWRARYHSLPTYSTLKRMSHDLDSPVTAHSSGHHDDGPVHRNRNRRGKPRYALENERDAAYGILKPPSESINVAEDQGTA
ncbi:hypothetical protein BKA62DRAFT_673425 [Auriculariales sp. MPI-PUGE-AT-0066]|nr:hypothetical protein BKA62DRAFT_673425 [Auriculariales sp. MPI-PUGE-AT-0066]